MESNRKNACEEAKFGASRVEPEDEVYEIKAAQMELNHQNPHGEVNYSVLNANTEVKD